MTAFPKKNRLRKSWEFRKVLSLGQRLQGSFLILQMSTRPLSSQARLGITASKKFGKAHQRNRFKRLAREAFRSKLPFLPPELSLVIIPRKRALHASLEEISFELSSLIEKECSPYAAKQKEVVC